MLAALLIAAESEKSKTPFYIFAAALVVYALAVSFFGIRKHETFPGSKGAATALIGVCVLLVAGTMVTAVVTS
jgi:hypothetical protein